MAKVREPGGSRVLLGGCGAGRLQALALLVLVQLGHQSCRKVKHWNCVAETVGSLPRFRTIFPTPRHSRDPLLQGVTESTYGLLFELQRGALFQVKQLKSAKFGGGKRSPPPPLRGV